MFLFSFAIVASLFWVSLSIYLLINRAGMRYLKSVNADPLTQPPVAIIIAVRNEEANLAEALQSVLQLDYANYRVILINDRSTDGTAGILSGFDKKHQNIRVITIEELPAGWLGKNHALHAGYQNTSEEWMLFTDADVLFQPDTLKKAIHYCLQEKLDHLTVLPDVQSRSVLLNSALATFIMMLEIKQRPWDVRKPDSKASLGVGAFNLVQRTAYEKAGTHKVIALRPDDDLKLGQRIKESGGKQDALYGKDQIGLEWYTSIREFINGLMKNTFSVYNYNFLSVLVKGVIPTMMFFVLPLPLLLSFGTNRERILAYTIVLFQILLFSVSSGTRTKWWYALLIPFSGLLMIYIMLKSSLLTLKQKGIYWRDSFYSLKELKKQS